MHIGGPCAFVLFCQTCRVSPEIGFVSPSFSFRLLPFGGDCDPGYGSALVARIAFAHLALVKWAPGHQLL
jgi:hypothetical protein